MIDILETLNQMSIKQLFENSELRQVPVTVSNTRKIDVSIIRQYAVHCLKDLHSKQRKNEQY